MLSKQDRTGKEMAILPTRVTRQKAHRLCFILNSRKELMPKALCCSCQK